MRSRAISSLPLLLVLAACGPTYVDFAYPPNDLKAVAPTGLKIAVVPFADERATYDEGSTAWKWMPGVPYATERRDARQEPGGVARGDYYYPGLFAYSLGLDLAHNALAERVDFAPPFLDDYDLVLHGRLHAYEEGKRALSYGLGPASFLTSWVGLPQGQEMVRLGVTYVAYDWTGAVVAEQRFDEEWSDLHWGSDPDVPAMHGRVTTLKDANRRFLETLLAKLDAHPFAPRDDARRNRARAFHARLDPTLPKLVEARDRMRRSDRPVERERAELLDRAIQRRAKLLESYRRTEERIVGTQQREVWTQQERLLADTAALRRTQRSIEAEQAALESQAFHATMRPLAGALVAGAMPAIGSANAAGSFGSPQWDMLAKDLSASLAALPPPPPPPPDLRPMLAELGIDEARGDEEAALLIGRIRAKSVPELRESFLDLYAKKFRLERPRRAAPPPEELAW